MSDSMTRRGFVKSVGYSGVAATALAPLTAAGGAEPESAGKATAGRLSAEKIRIGTLVQAESTGGPANYIRQILPHGFESFSLCSAVPGRGRPGEDGRRSQGGARRQRRGDLQRRHLRQSAGAMTSPPTAGSADRRGAAVRLQHRHRFRRPDRGQADARLDAAVRRGLRPAGQAGRRQGRAAGLRELPDGRQLEPRRLEHRPQPDGLGTDVQRRARWRTSACNGSRATRWCNLIDPLAATAQVGQEGLPPPRQGRDDPLGRDPRARHRRPDPFAFHRTPGFGDSNWTDIIPTCAGRFQGQHRHRRLARSGLPRRTGNDRPGARA